MVLEFSRRFQGQHISSRLKVLPSCLDPNFCVLVKLLDFCLLSWFGDIGDTLIAHWFFKPNWGSVMLCMRLMPYFLQTG
jgi:hypothetical protein